MKYKQLIQDKLNQLDILSRNIDSSASLGSKRDINQFTEDLRDKIEEIRTLINSQTALFE